MKRLAVLDKGWVQLEESMGGDAAVIRGARICYNGAPSGFFHCSETGCMRERLQIPSGERPDATRAAASALSRTPSSRPRCTASRSPARTSTVLTSRASPVPR